MFFAPVFALAVAQVPPDSVEPDPVAYAIDATLDERARLLLATERIEYRNGAGLALPRLYLQLFPNAFRDGHTAYARDHARLPWISNPLDWIPWGSRRGFITIRSVRIDGRESGFAVRETVMEIPLASPLAPGTALRVEIAFEVKLPVLQLALGYRGSSYAMALWYPKLAIPDTAGWRGDREPSDAAFHADCGSYDVRITAPRDVVVAATGEPADTADNGDGTTTRRWRAGHVRYFAWVADRRYRVKRIAWNDVTVTYLYLGREDKALARGLETVRAALDGYTTRYGPYPHRTLVIAETPALGSGVGGITYSQLVMLPAGLRHGSLPGLSYREILAHEIAHQWWGMTVGVRDAADDWLNEGIAEFAAFDLDRQRDRREGSAYRRGEYLNLAALGFDGKIVQPDSAFDGILEREVALYAKAPLVLRMLQHLVGPDTLDRALRAYVSHYRFQTGRTADLIAVADSVSGQDLWWFFSEWLDRTATCDYGVDDVIASARSPGQYRSVIRVTRNGRIVMPVEVEITLQDGRVLRRAWAGREASYQITIDSAPPVRRVVLDPDRHLLETNRSNNFYPRRVRSSFLPRLAQDDAYRIVHLPLAFYDDGLELGLLVAGVRTIYGIPPTRIQAHHLAVVAGGYHLATKSGVARVAYASPLGLLGRRASWSLTARRDGKGEAAALSVGALFGSHFSRSPFHMASVSLAHERRFETTPEWDQGTVNGIQAGYTLRGLVTDFYPLHGTMLAVEVEGGSKSLGSDWSFLRAAGRVELYRRLWGGTRLALSAFAGTVAAGAAPRQKSLWLSREGNFRAAPSDTVSGPHLTAVNVEVRVPLGTGTLFGVAGFCNLAKYWGPGPEAAGGLRREAGIGLRLLDNAHYAVQLDAPLWTADGARDGERGFTHVSFRVGRPFRGPGS